MHPQLLTSVSCSGLQLTSEFSSLVIQSKTTLDVKFADKTLAKDSTLGGTNLTSGTCVKTVKLKKMEIENSSKLNSLVEKTNVRIVQIQVTMGQTILKSSESSESRKKQEWHMKNVKNFWRMSRQERQQMTNISKNAQSVGKNAGEI